MAKNTEKTATTETETLALTDKVAITFTPAVRDAIDKRKAEIYKVARFAPSDIQLVYQALEEYLKLPSGAAIPAKGRAASAK